MRGCLILLLQSKGLRVAAVQLIEEDGLAIRQSIVSKNVSGTDSRRFSRSTNGVARSKIIKGRQARGEVRERRTASPTMTIIMPT